jgi:UDP-3-O-[3-hydroxymyristoyl] glucosamine N-acyltransferase
MEFSAQQIANIIQGVIEGDSSVIVNRLSKIEEGQPGSLTFLANPLYTHYIYTTQASVAIVNKDFVSSQRIKPTLIKVDSAEIAFAKLLEVYNKMKLDKKGISKKCTISENAKIGNDVYIGDYSFIGENVFVGNNVKIYPQVFVGDNSRIGDNTVLYAGVRIYDETVIGQDCIIHSGVVLGSDGFRFATQNGENTKVPQIGNVVIEDKVEIGANCAIDRATLGSTIIRKGAKLDNLVHIAHNVDIGESTYIAANNVIAGSTKIGKNCMFSGQVGIIGHLNIADGTIIAAQSGISKSIPKPGQAYMGSPAFNAQDYRKAYVHFRNLDNLLKRLEKLEGKIGDSSKD